MHSNYRSLSNKRRPIKNPRKLFKLPVNSSAAVNMAPWRRKFSRHNVLFICYGTAVEHRSLLNRSGICDGINRYNILLFMQSFWVLKTAFNLVKIHLLFRIIPLIQWCVMFCRPCFNLFWGLKYIPRLCDIPGLCSIFPEAQPQGI